MPVGRLTVGRIVADGPAAANIPGVVAGLEYLFRHYGSGKVKWEDLVAPAITLADEGFVLDEALPTTIAEGRRYLEKWPEAAKIYLPGGTVPRPGDRFFNKDYANTLRGIQKGGAEAFYRGEIARTIVADMEANGGILTAADLAQYRAMEREPIAGHYRGHTLYAGGPPVSTGIQLFESLHVLEHTSRSPASARRWMRTNKAKFKVNPGPYSALSYDAMNLLADAIKRAGATDKKAVAAALKATKEFKGISGPVSFTDKNLLARSNFVVLVVKDKKFNLAK